MPKSKIADLASHRSLLTRHKALQQVLGPQRLGAYVLNAAGAPEVAATLESWFAWRQSTDRVIAQTSVGAACVVTTFTGLDAVCVHRRPVGLRPRLRDQPDEAPILWDTRVVGGPQDGRGHAYTTRDAALRGHDAMVARLRAGQEVWA